MGSAGQRLIHCDPVSHDRESGDRKTKSDVPDVPDLIDASDVPDAVNESDVVRASDPSDSDDLPVVARLMVEIRSDGTRTIARGAMEEVTSGQRIAVEARGDSPAQMAWALAHSIFATPSLARKTVRALLPGRRRRKRG